jgi:uncharacterized protein YcgL (UPF0745 family)
LRFLDRLRLEVVTSFHMHVRVLKSNKLQGLYIYLPNESDLLCLPEELFEKLGELTEVLNFELHLGKKLAQVQARAVLDSIQKQGYYLQMPPNKREVYFG